MSRGSETRTDLLKRIAQDVAAAGEEGKRLVLDAARARESYLRWRPCKTEQHEVKKDFVTGMWGCVKCSLYVQPVWLVDQEKGMMRGFREDGDLLRWAFRRAERDWYIQELES